MYAELESPSEGACLRYMVSRNRQRRGVFNMYDEPESPNDGACLIYRINRSRQMRGFGIAK